MHISSAALARPQSAGGTNQSRNLYAPPSLHPIPRLGPASLGYAGSQRPHKTRTHAAALTQSEPAALHVTTAGLKQRVSELEECCRRLTREAAEATRQKERLQQQLSVVEGNNDDLRQGGARPLTARSFEAIATVVREAQSATRSALAQSGKGELSFDTAAAATGRDRSQWTVAGWLGSLGVPELIAATLLRRLQAVEAAQ